MILVNRHRYPLSILLSIVFFSILFSSCNSAPDEVPFPQKELSYSKPVSVPMVFTAEKKTGMGYRKARRGNSCNKKI